MKGYIFTAIFLIGTGSSISLMAKNYHVSFGKFTHIKTTTPVETFIAGNETWNIQSSPHGDGLFVWSKRESLPTNIKMYTKTHSYIVNLSPSKIEHIATIRPVGESLPVQEIVNISKPSDIEVLEQKANNKILENKKGLKLHDLSVVKNKRERKDTVNVIVTGKQEVSIKEKVKGKTLVTTKEDAPVEEVANIGELPKPLPKPKIKTIREVVNHYNTENGYTLVERSFDEKVLEAPSSMQKIESLNDLKEASNGLISAVFIDPVAKTIRVK